MLINSTKRLRPAATLQLHLNIVEPPSKIYAIAMIIAINFQCGREVNLSSVLRDVTRDGCE